MSIVCFPIGASGYPISTTAQFAAGLVWEVISQQDTSAGAGKITFSSIPAGYKLFMLVGRVTAATASQPVGLRFNGDGNANYGTQILNVANAAVSGGANTDRHCKLTNGNYVGECFAVISNFTALAKKCVSHCGTLNLEDINTSRWNNTTAEISSIVAGGLSGTTETNLAQNCYLTLFGMR